MKKRGEGGGVVGSLKDILTICLIGGPPNLQVISYPWMREPTFIISQVVFVIKLTKTEQSHRSCSLAQNEKEKRESMLDSSLWTESQVASLIYLMIL